MGEWRSVPRYEGELQPFGGIYTFLGQKWCIIVWAHNWGEAVEYGGHHGLTIHGQYIKPSSEF